jgi:hypothetical protein
LIRFNRNNLARWKPTKKGYRKVANIGSGIQTYVWSLSPQPKLIKKRGILIAYKNLKENINVAAFAFTH